MSHISKIISFLGVGLISLLVFVTFDDQEVLIESRESKTASAGPVFNRIKWFQSASKDIWMMNQSHHGADSAPAAWDRLAIVIDKTKSPKVARFYQLEPGPLEWKEDLKEVPLRVSCFMCHNNGPRRIRPNFDSPFDPTDLRDRVKIFYWNLKIELYGRVLASAEHEERDQKQSPPFRFRGPYENEALEVKTCTLCHKESGFLARGQLRRQQLPTIRFMLESGQMPPMGFRLSSEEKRSLQMFLDGF